MRYYYPLTVVLAVAGALALNACTGDYMIVSDNNDMIIADDEVDPASYEIVEISPAGPVDDLAPCEDWSINMDFEDALQDTEGSRIWTWEGQGDGTANLDDWSTAVLLQSDNDMFFAEDCFRMQEDNVMLCVRGSVNEGDGGSLTINMPAGHYANYMITRVCHTHSDMYIAAEGSSVERIIDPVGDGCDENETIVMVTSEAAGSWFHLDVQPTTMGEINNFTITHLSIGRICSVE